MAGSTARMRTWTMVPVRTGDNGWHQPDRQPRKGRCSCVGSGDKDFHHIFFRGGAFRKNRGGCVSKDTQAEPQDSETDIHEGHERGQAEETQTVPQDREAEAEVA